MNSLIKKIPYTYYNKRYTLSQKISPSTIIFRLGYSLENEKFVSGINIISYNRLKGKIHIPVVNILKHLTSSNNILGNQIFISYIIDNSSLMFKRSVMFSADVFLLNNSEGLLSREIFSKVGDNLTSITITKKDFTCFGNDVISNLPVGDIQYVFEMRSKSTKNLPVDLLQRKTTKKK